MGASGKGSSAAGGPPSPAMVRRFMQQKGFQDLLLPEPVVVPSSVANDVNLGRYAHGYADHRPTPGDWIEINQRRSERGGFGATAASLA